MFNFYYIFSYFLIHSCVCIKFSNALSTILNNVDEKLIITKSEVIYIKENEISNHLDWADLKEVLRREIPELNYETVDKIVELLGGIVENKINQKVKKQNEKIEKQKVFVYTIGKAVIK